jgi:hypothetical protein
VNAIQGKSFLQGKKHIALWFGFLAAPLIWFVNLELNFMLAPWACATGRQFSLGLVTLVALLLVASAGLLAWRMWLHAGQEWLHNAGGRISSRRFLAMLGILTSSLFFLAILAQGAPTFILSACPP